MTIILCWLGLHRRPESITSGLYCCRRCGCICGVPLPLKTNTNREKHNG